MIPRQPAVQPRSIAPTDDGLFQSGGILRKVGREAIGVLGGGRALLLQLAHPLVAAGVSEHSRFRDEPLLRLERTLDLIQSVIFGSRSQAEAALRQFHAGHAHIRGRLVQAAGYFPVGQSYTAQDPALKLWVLAALLDTQLLMYELFVAPLPADERQSFFAEGRLLGEWLGIPAAMFPATTVEFREYMETMWAGDAIAVTETSYTLAWALLDPPVGPAARACASLARFVTAGLLPDRLRRDYGLEWSKGRQMWLDALARTGQRLAPIVPAWLRYLSLPGQGGFVRWVIQNSRRSSAS